MAVSATLYDKFILNQATGATKIDFDSAPIDVRLLTSGYTPNLAADEFWSDIVANEVAAGDYATGGQALTGITVALAAHAVTVVAADPVWSASTITARYAAYVLHTGSSATDRLICLVDFGTDESSVASDFTITLSADGFLKWTA